MLHVLPTWSVNIQRHGLFSGTVSYERNHAVPLWKMSHISNVHFTLNFKTDFLSINLTNEQYF